MRRLPQPRTGGEVPLETALATRRSVRAFAPDPLSQADLAQILWAAQGITGEDGARTAPSAGALYPLDLIVVAGAVLDLETGLYRYHPREHALTLAAVGDRRTALAAACLEQDWLASAPVAIVIAAEPRRTARRYGGRAARYIAMEVGHVAQNVHLQATALGLGTVVVGAFQDGKVREILGLSADVDPMNVLPLGRPA